MKRYIYFIVVSLWIAISVSAQNQEAVRVACVGNSITYGAGLQKRFQNSYPGVLQQMLGKGYDVRNYGISARTLLNKGDYPYMKENAYKEALAFLPNIVTIKLGTNDSKPHNWIYGKEFKNDLQELVLSFKNLPSKPKIYLCLPVPPTKVQWGINDSTIVESIIPIIKSVAKKYKVEVIDLHTALLPYPNLFPDCVHPNSEASAIIAANIYKALKGEEPEPYDYTMAFPGEKSQWNGYDKYDFICEGRDATVVCPKNAAKGNPWIWRPAFFGAFPSVDVALLEKGFHVAYYDLTHLYGSPRSVKLGTDFYNIMTRDFRLSGKVTLEGFSRGGYFVFNWAAQNPDKVACIYVDAPVCNILSWPGRKGSALWNDFLKEWNVSDADVNDSFRGNALQLLNPIVQNNIPVISVCGDSDKTVPYNENFRQVREALSNAGGNIELILKPGVDHHPHSLENPEAVVDFILRNQPGEAGRSHINQRNGIKNSLVKFSGSKKGCVAFLGGSITEMKGWKDMMKDDLMQRFPQTDFSFIDAGISSTGSTPHAFRFEKDVLEKGVPDLLFVEAAVNDDTNGFTPQEQVMALEGIVRHARKVNPKMDIVILHFIYDPFIPLLEKGVMPDVILNHERVANWYSLPSINLALEISERMADNEFDWNKFGGTHPSWFGHKFYAASINRLLDWQWKNIKGHELTDYQMPEKPLEPNCYDSGKFIPITAAKVVSGFRIIDGWKPSIENVGVRSGFVDVPMLESHMAGSQFYLDFEGTAIGIFCVCGPNSSILSYSVDGKPFKEIDTMTEWSPGLYIPWVYMFEKELAPGKHRIVVKVKKGVGEECQIRNFVVNQVNK